MERCGSSLLSACDVIKEVLFCSIAHFTKIFFFRTTEITHISSEISDISSEALKKDRNESVKLFAGNLVT